MRHVMFVAGYILATLATQATSHFALFSNHYAEVAHIKTEPVFALGLFSMMIQGAVLSYVFVNSRFSGRSLFHALAFAWLFGAFLVSYIALAEAAKYAVPTIPSWIAVEAGVGFVQFSAIGVVLGLIHGRPALAVAREAGP